MGGKEKTPTGGATSGVTGQSATGVRLEEGVARRVDRGEPLERGEVRVEQQPEAPSIAGLLGDARRRLGVAGQERPERGGDLVGEDRVVRGAQVGSAREPVLDELDSFRRASAAAARSTASRQARLTGCRPSSRNTATRSTSTASRRRSAMTASARSRSAAWRASGPAVPNCCIPAAGSHGACAGVGITSRPARRPKTPFQAAGARIEPPRSVPIPSGLSAAASATASPPEEPPAVRRSCAFRVAP